MRPKAKRALAGGLLWLLAAPPTPRSEILGVYLPIVQAPAGSSPERAVDSKGFGVVLGSPPIARIDSHEVVEAEVVEEFAEVYGPDEYGHQIPTGKFWSFFVVRLRLTDHEAATQRDALKETCGGKTAYLVLAGKIVSTVAGIGCGDSSRLSTSFDTLDAALHFAQQVSPRRIKVITPVPTPERQRPRGEG